MITMTPKRRRVVRLLALGVLVKVAIFGGAWLLAAATL